MSMPGFAAEASLGRGVGHYRVRAGSAAEAGGPRVFAQLTLWCPAKGCGPCVRDPESSKGGRKCCCHPGGECPTEVECQWPPPPPPPPPRQDCGTHTCATYEECCANGCCPPGSKCCHDKGLCTPCVDTPFGRYCWPCFLP
jgi:hypothetical protein